GTGVQSRNLPRARCRAKLENVDERNTLFASHARRRTRIDVGRAGRCPRHRGRDHGCRDRPRGGAPRRSHGGGGPGRSRARILIVNMRSAAQAGALVASYAAATALIKPDGRVGGATVRDGLTGRASTVRALVVVNATGPWVDRVRRLDDARAEPLLRPTKGVHVAVPRKRVGHTRAVTLTSPIDGRVMFVLPWGDLSYIGTTDTDEDASPDEVRATADDVVYLLRSANAFFPHARLAPADIIASWVGLRPLLRPPRDVTPSASSREHRVVASASGLLTVAGGKLTTYRVMARDLVDRVAARLRELDGRP